MGSQIAIRVFLDSSEQAKAAAFAETVRERLAPFADIIRLETKRYWKIPEWSELLVIAQVPTTPDVGSVFNNILSTLGDGWEKHGASDEQYQWAVWNPKPDCTFCCQLVRWANVELFPGTEHTH